jgi:hypothetical protein
MDIGCELLAEVDRLHARLAERGEVRPRATDTWAVAWDLPEGTRYSFPMENERYAREGFADLVRSGVTGIRLVVSRNGGKWRPVGESAG